MANADNKRTYAGIGKFAELAAERIRGLRPGLQVSVERVPKNNTVCLTGLRISDGRSQITPLIYLEDYFEIYVQGADLKRIALNILTFYEDKISGTVFPVAHRLYDGFGNVKDKIFYKLVNYKWNKEQLSEVPHIRFQNLAIVFHILLEMNDDGVASVRIRNEMLEGWGIRTPEELFQAAHENTHKLFPARVQTMGSIINEFLGDPSMEQMEAGKPPMYIVTNLATTDGAAVILYDNLLSDLSKKIGGDFFILPSSLHEVIAVPVMAGMNALELKAIVGEVNRTQVRDIEILSDSVYRYDAKNARLEIAVI